MTLLRTFWALVPPSVYGGALLLLLTAISGCSTGGDGCRIDGRKHAVGALNPGNRCQQCDPAQSRTEWTPSPEGTECGLGRACSQGRCVRACMVGDRAIVPGQQHPVQQCRVCTPVSSGAPRFEQSDDGLSCGDNLYCLSGHCVSACLIAGELHDDGRRNPNNPCEQCLADKSSTRWSVGPDGPYVCPETGSFCLSGECIPGCFVNGVAVPLGSTHPFEPCLVCPNEGHHGWLALDDRTPCGSDLECREGSCVPRKLDVTVHRLGEGELHAVGGSSREVYVGGADGIWRSEDGSEWKLDADNLPAPILHFANRPGPLTIVYALDAEGGLWQGGGGVNWNRRHQLLAGARSFWVAPHAEYLLAVGENGEAWMGTGPDSLLPIVTGVAESLHDVSGESADAAWVVGARGTVLRWDGVDWETISIDTSSIDTSVDLNAVHVVDHHIIAVGAEGTVVRSDDGGASWTVTQPAAAFETALHSIVRAGDDWFAVGDLGTFIRSSDNGETWRREAIGTVEDLLSVWEDGKGRVVAAGRGGTVVVGY